MLYLKVDGEEINLQICQPVNMVDLILKGKNDLDSCPCGIYILWYLRIRKAKQRPNTWFKD